MDQSDFYRKLIEAIQEMAQKKNALVYNTTSRDFTIQLAVGIKEKAEEIIKSNDISSNSLHAELVRSMLEKLWEETQQKIDILEAAYTQKVRLICSLVQKLDTLVLPKDARENKVQIDNLLDELFPAAEDRERIASLIKEYKTQKP